jgi:FAD/FMN-containing dehydrogenase
MNRRRFLEYLAGSLALPALAPGWPEELPAFLQHSPRQVRRVRPGDPLWPAAASWNQLQSDVGGRLIALDPPLGTCRTAPAGAACVDLVRKSRNPYAIGDDPALTQTSGYTDAWISAPSTYAVAAAETADVVAAVNFARNHNLRLVVKGGGHSYQGTSSSADSLLIWTRAMDDIVLHDSFVPQGCAAVQPPRPAVTIGAGARWGQVYDAVTTRAGRYVQGGGCTTVGVAGLIQSGGFGSFSKRYGLAAAGLLEAEVVTADGVARVTNACTHPDLFWALKGGGGGSFGVVTRITLRTRELPEYFGIVYGTIRAHSETAFRRLTARIFAFYRDHLFNPHWGEQLHFGPNHTLELGMVFQGLSRQEAENTWRPFLDWVAGAPRDFTLHAPVEILDIPARHIWNPAVLEELAPQLVAYDDRPDAPAGNFYWAGDQGQVGQFLHAFHSTWLSASLLEGGERSALADAIVAATRHWRVTLQFNKGLAGAPTAEIAAARNTAINPAALDAFALAIIASNGPPAFPGIPGHEPDLAAAERNAAAVARAVAALSTVVVDRPASYLAESDFFERDWQQSFWGGNYPRLAAVKEKYDPDGLFFVHHGVGSEGWSADGFTRGSG